jgi:nucleoside-diphosphate-sugar epimerase
MIAGVESLAGRRVLVTGASGFIGAALCRRLGAIGAEVHGTSRTRAAIEGSKGSNWHACELEDPAATRTLVSNVRPEVILHLASHVTGTRTADAVLTTFYSNLASTVNVLLCAHEIGCGRVVLTGSLEEPEPGPDWPLPSSPYAAAKLAAGAYGRMFHALYGLPVVQLRVFMVYGPGTRDEKKIVPYVITTLLRGEAPRLGPGTRPVDWIFVEDVVDAYLAASTAPDAVGGILDVGSGELVSVRRVVETIFDIVRPGFEPAFGALAERPLEQVRVADIDASRARLGWRPSTTLRAGLERTVTWYAART